MSAPANHRALLIGVALAMTGTTASAAPTVEPARVERVEQAERARARWLLRWEGEPASIEVASDGGWQLLAADAVSPYTTEPLPGSVRFRLTLADGVAHELTGHRLWTPADVASWSGPGLRGAEVTALAPSSIGLWVATRSGGAALWQDQRWRHLDHRDGLPHDALHDLALRERERWVAHPTGVTRISGDGTLKHWEIPGGAARIAVEPERVWALTDEGVMRLTDDGAELILREPGCEDLVQDEVGAWLVVCDDALKLPSGLPALTVPEGVALRAIVPRTDGAWIATADLGLLLRIGADVVPSWTPPEGALTDAIRLDLGMLLAAGAGGLWHATSDETPTRLTTSHGLPGGDALLLASGPRVAVAWLGTTRGVALVQRDGTAVALPLAPLPADVEVRDVAPVRGGAGVASALGLVWLGGRPPAGWASLVAAAGPEAHALFLDRDEGWWALAGEVAFHLDPDGEVHRWPLGAAAIAGAPFADGVALATAEGLRAWSPGATRLSPIHLLPGVQRLVASPDGALWVLHDGQLSRWTGRSAHTWDELPEVLGLDADAQGAWLATADGLLRITPGRDAPARLAGLPPPPPLVDVSVAGGELHLLTQDGQVLRPRGEAWEAVELGAALPAVPHGLVGDEHGVWVRTDRGLFRLVDRPGR